MSLRRKFTILLCGVLPFIAAQSQTPLVLQDSATQQYTALHDHTWRFKPGDSLAWAAPAYDDNNWDTARIKFGSNNIPKGWNNFGWFRIWIRKESTASTNTWGIYINQDAASEIYLDGKKIMTLGKPGYSKQTSIAERAPFLSIPITITDTLPHLLAIRYSNYHHFFRDFIGFQAWMSDLHYMHERQQFQQHLADLWLLSAAAQAILIVLHLLLFIFYPKQKINLYYSFFVIVTFICLLSRYLTVVTGNPAVQVLSYKAFTISIQCITFTAALLLYSVSNTRLPKRKLAVIGTVSLFFIFLFLAKWNDDWTMAFLPPYVWITNLFCLAVFTDGVISVIRAIRKGNKKLWLIAVGMLIVSIVSILVGSNLLNIFMFHQIMTIMSFTCLLMPVLFSIYIAMDIAATNRKLANQLEENKRLAAANLAQEQEKNRLISEQAEKLENTVLERTAQIREQAEKLKEMDAAKSRFFVNLTHEFKTPLTLIINPAKELLQHPDKEAARQYARFILQNTERLLELINQLLDLSRLENGQMDIKTQQVDIVQWLQIFVQQFSSLAEQKEIQLQFFSNTGSLRITTDLDKLEKIVQNLISNALKFINENGAVSISLEQKEGHLIDIKVKDNGIGIAPDKLPYIFDRFYQADATDTRSREGTGIGLALVKELAELLGGNITVTSAEQIGTTFTIILPYQPATGIDEHTDYPARSLKHETVADNITATGITPNAETILVAEDNEQLRQFIELAIGNLYTVLLARNGAEGINMALNSIPNLIITDLMMPEKNGYELCRILKQDERTSHIPVIMLTAKTDQQSKIQGIETGVDAYLVKPFDKSELLALIANLIATRKQLREKYSSNNHWLTNAVELPSIEQAFLQRIREAINNHLDDEHFGAEELGKQVGLSRTQLHRKLKDIIDQSPGELIRTIRMQRAHELLQKNAATVAEVCYMVGYTNPANFSTSFSKHFGYPPSDVAKQKVL